MKTKEIFNPAFKDLNKIVKKSLKEKKTVPKQVPARKQETTEKSIPDKDYFREAMQDVTPLSSESKDRMPGGPKTVKPSHPVPDETEEVMEHLRGLVAGSVEMDITFSDEYIEGAISGVSNKILRKLKRGQLPIQAHIDLHGLTKKEAADEVRRFLINSHRRGLRCVLIVHGRGLNSPDSIPVLKESLPAWLNRGPARKIVLAFATARPYDGGTGAIYVLLRKR